MKNRAMTDASILLSQSEAGHIDFVEKQVADLVAGRCVVVETFFEPEIVIMKDKVLLETGTALSLCCVKTINTTLWLASNIKKMDHYFIL